MCGAGQRNTKWCLSNRHDSEKLPEFSETDLKTVFVSVVSTVANVGIPLPRVHEGAQSHTCLFIRIKEHINVGKKRVSKLHFILLFFSLYFNSTDSRILILCQIPLFKDPIQPYFKMYAEYSTFK